MESLMAIDFLPGKLVFFQSICYDFNLIICYNFILLIFFGKLVRMMSY